MSLSSNKHKFKNPWSVYFIHDKRKASMDNLMQQPPLKKVATKGSMGAMPGNPLTVDIQGATGGYSTSLGGSDVVSPSISRPLLNENISGSSGRREKTGGQAQKMSTSLHQAWKEDTNGGHFLPLLSEYFGDSMLSFVHTPELSIFL